MHDPRVGRFFAEDPLAGKYTWNSPYAFSENRVIDKIELEGLEATDTEANQAQAAIVYWMLYKKIGSARKILDLSRDELEKNPWISGILENPAVISQIKGLSARQAYFEQKADGSGEFYKELFNSALQNGTVDDVVDVFNLQVSEMNGEILALGNAFVYAFSASTGYFNPNGLTPKAKISTFSAYRVSNMRVALDFYKQSGFTTAKALEHMKGIDFSKPVEKILLEKGTVIQQWVGKRGIGNYFTTLKNGSKQNLGVSTDGRKLIQYKLKTSVEVLKSTAKKFEGNAGGGVQFFSKKLKEVIEVID